MKFKSPRRFRHTRLVGLLLTLLAGLLVGSYISRVRAQGSCYTPEHLLSLTPRFQPNTEITVIFDQTSNFSLAQRNAMNQAFKNWNAWRHPWGHNTEVKFKDGIVAAAPNYGTAVNTVHIHKSPDSQFTLGPAKTFSTGTTYTNVCEIEIKQSWTGAGTTLTNIFAHEIGHGFRLKDCYPQCNTGALSVMGGAVLSGPTLCDNCSVRNVYLGVAYNTACTLPPIDTQQD
jgi:hypothetical protein